MPPSSTLLILKVERKKEKKQSRKHRASQKLLQGGISQEHLDLNKTSLAGCYGFVRAELNSQLKIPRTSLCTWQLSASESPEPGCSRSQQVQAEAPLRRARLGETGL